MIFNGLIKVRSNSPQWLTRELLEEIYHRDRLYKQAKFSNTDEDWKLYRAKRNEEKKIIKSSQGTVRQREIRKR